MFSARSRFNSAIASCADRFVSDEYDDLDSASNLTAFARNSGVYRVPFAMVPSSPIELEEKRNKKTGHINYLDTVAEELNDRPRKTLGFMKPSEKIIELLDTSN